MLDVEYACGWCFGAEEGAGMPLEDDTDLLVGIPDCTDAEDSRFVSDAGGEVAERLFLSRLLGTGRDGRGPVGGLSDGRGGRMAVAIVLFWQLVGIFTPGCEVQKRRFVMGYFN